MKIRGKPLKFWLSSGFLVLAVLALFAVWLIALTTVIYADYGWSGLAWFSLGLGALAAFIWSLLYLVRGEWDR